MRWTVTKLFYFCCDDCYYHNIGLYLIDKEKRRDRMYKFRARKEISRHLPGHNDDDDVFLMNYNMAVGYEIYLHTNTDQPERQSG
jgi:hypothetical protein